MILAFKQGQDHQIETQIEKYCKRNTRCAQDTAALPGSTRYSRALKSLPVLVKFAAALLIFLSPLVRAVEFRAATYNIGAHFTNDGFPDYSLGKAGTPDHDRVREVLGRINADVVALQEIASADVSGTPSDLRILANSLNYPYIYIAPVAAASPLSGPIDTSLRLAFLSRHPFITTQVIRSPQGAREITRLMPVVKVDIPGTTRDPVLISAHLKAGTALADRFRRTVEMRRLKNELTARGFTADDNFIILGDFNLSSTNRTFDEIPSGLPVSYVLGDNVILPISYSTNPLSYFGSPPVTRLDPRQLNGSKATFQSGSVIDLFLVSSAIAGRALQTEIYNSALDTSNLTGLPKAGEPLASGTSLEASDHYALFADFELDEDYPNIALTLSTPSVLEGSPDGTASLTVTLPGTRTTPLTVNIKSDDPAAALPLSAELVIPAGALSGSLPIRTPRNFIEDPQRSVSFTATAVNYDPSSGVLVVDDTDGPYTFTAVGETVSETFNGFGGNHAPAPWVSSGGNWLGSDSSTSAAPGFRAYGPAGDAAFGFIPQAVDGSATATFINGSPEILTALQISFTARQWRVVAEGTADSLLAELLVNGASVPLPQLTFQTSSGPGPLYKTAIIGNLSISPGASFELRFVFSPGPGVSPLPADIFVNEFHYDNNGVDVGEFVEVVVGPGFQGALADIDVLLVNGSNGATYGTYNLAGPQFSQTAEVNGFRIFAADTPGIQNGTPDGIAVINSTAGKLLHFLSYEGTFNATSGFPPGAPLGSTNIGVSQNGTEAIGQQALGLIGSGESRTDFTWSKIPGPYSKGLPNAGQTLAVTPSPSQGISFDDLSITFLLDSDGDGIPDITDPDNDNDGMSDADESVFGTDPFDAASIYQITLASHAPGLLRLAFPTSLGRSYTVETSPDLLEWNAAGTHQGTGDTRILDFAINPLAPALFYRIKATLPPGNAEPQLNPFGP